VADEAMDEAWVEPMAFDGCSTKGQAKPGEAQPIHFVRKSAPKSGATA
jgi:nitrate reductase molybdenum cofactor assembly chaperone NarJ/NarW